MASSANKNNSMEYDKTMYKKPVVERKNHLAERLNKFQEKVNQTRAPPPPVLQYVHDQQEIDRNILNDIKHVYQLIKDNGQQGDYAVQLKFGELVPIFGPNVDKLVEILSIARKQGYINYSGSIERLQQEKDEEVLVKLIKQPY